jgi:hypothetical protein
MGLIHKDEETQKGIIQSWLRKPIPKLRANRAETEKHLRILEEKLKLLTWYENNPDSFEEKVESLKEAIKPLRFKVDVMTNIITRRTK